MSAGPSTLAAPPAPGDAASAASAPKTRTGRTVLVLGGSSAIARGIAAAFARRGYAVALGGRDVSELERTAADLSIRTGSPVRATHFDASDPGGHRALIDGLGATGELAGVVVAFGLLGDQARARIDVDHAHAILEANFAGVVGILTHVANALERQGHGFIVGVSSVAGDRGRQSNYVYGAAKAGATVFLQGLRNRLAHHGVHVMTVKPGFVDTRMTWGLPGMFLVAQPDDVGERIVRALERRRDVVYVPGMWRWIMLLIRSIPERLFKRLKL